MPSPARILLHPAVVLSGGLAGALVSLRAIVGYAGFTSDLSQEYIASLAIRGGVSLYGPEAQALHAEATGLGGMPNFHPPFLGALAAPVSWWSYPTVFVTWGLLSFALYLGLVAALVRRLGFEPRTGAAIVVLAPLWYPAYASLATGQVSILVAVLLVGGWMVSTHPRGRVVAGVFLGLAALLKLYPAFVGLYYLLRRDFVVLGACLLTGALGVLGTVALVGTDDIVRYVTEIAPSNAVTYRASYHNQSIAGVAWRLFGSDPRWILAPLPSPPLRAALGALGPLAVLAITAWQTAKHLAAGRDTSAFALVCLGMLLLSPVAWQHYFVVAALPLLVLLRHGARTGAWTLVGLLLLLEVPDAAWAGALGLSAAPVPFRLAQAPLFSYFAGLVWLFALSARGLPAVSPPGAAASSPRTS